MKKEIFFSLLFLLTIYIQAQDFDNTFGSGGVKIIDLGSVVDESGAIEISDQGNIFISGSFVGSQSIQAVLIKMNSSGQLDVPDFDSDGIIKFTFPTVASNPLILDNNRTLLASAYYNNGDYHYIIHCNDTITGSLDNSFNTTGELVFEGIDSNHPIGFKIQNGKYLLLESSALIRINANGTLDNTFGTGGILSLNTGSYLPTTMALDVSGNIFISTQNDNLSRVYKFLADGTTDNGFGNTGKIDINLGGTNDRISSIVIQNDGKILLAGNKENMIAVVRLTSSGDPDLSFNSTGTVSEIIHPEGPMTAKDIKIDETNGDILVCGYCSVGEGFYMVLTRFSSTGDTEAIKTIRIGPGTNIAKAMAIQPDRKIVLTGIYGENSDWDVAVVRVNPDFSSYTAVSTTEPSISQSINIFPNPASHRINIHSPFELQEITVQDMFGKTLIQTSANGNTSLDISNLSKGVYNCFVKTDKGSGVKKIIVQ